VVERRLGAGAMGTAYLARDLTLHRPVVIKALPRRYAGATRRLEGEARAMARMSDSRLASIFGLETWQGAPLLVMEYLAGGTLADRLGKGRLPVEEALTIGSTLAKGLQVLHDNGVLHRDVKPTNIGFTGERAPKLLDFGLASLIDDTADPFELAGTPLYLAPELLAGEPPSPFSDLWSLALVLFEAIAGRHPLASSTVTGTLRAVASANIPALSTMNPDVPPSVDDLFGRLLARNPPKRPQSAAQMVEQLDRALHLVRSR
jgi:eukaryotic-like serine/threonine-protein kinase